MNSGDAYVLRPMSLEDVPQVAAIDRASFPLPWSEASFRSELDRNPAAHMIVAASQRRVAGYAGFWLVVDEAHLSTLAVHPDSRRQGLGDRLLREAMRVAVAHGAEMMTLEVRPSNTVARRLYEKRGFREVGRRPRYYKDNLEDAILMTRMPLSSRRARLLEKVDGH